MAKKSSTWDELVGSMRKAQDGKTYEEDEDIVIVDEDEDVDDYSDFEDGGEDTEDADVDGEDTGDDDFEDATPALEKANESIGQIKDVLLGVVAQLDSLGATQKALHKSQNAIMKRLKMPVPKKAVTQAAELSEGEAGKLAKSQGKAVRHKQFDQASFEQARKLLLESHVDWQTADCIDQQMQKSMRDPNFQISPKYVKLLVELADKK